MIHEMSLSKKIISDGTNTYSDLDVSVILNVALCCPATFKADVLHCLLHCATSTVFLRKYCGFCVYLQSQVPKLSLFVPVRWSLHTACVHL